MHPPFRLAGFLTGLVIGVGCARTPAALSESHAAAIRDSVTAALVRLQQFSSTGQWDSLVTLYSTSPGFRFAESGVIRYRSATDIRDALAQVPPGTRIESTYRETEIDAVAPGAAVLTTLFETSFADSAGGRFSFGGALTMLWVHEPTGWRIRADHSSAPVPRGS